MYKIILELEGRTYFLTSVNLGKYNRGAEYGQSPNDNSLQLQIRTIKLDTFLWNWAGGDTVTKKNGKIRLVDGSTDMPVQTYTFEHAYVTASSMGFYIASDVSEVSLTVMAATLSVEIHENPTSVKGGRG